MSRDKFPTDRRGYLAAIHIAQKALGLSADDAIALKQQVVGVQSAGDMTLSQLRTYTLHLSRLQERRTGGVSGATIGGRPMPTGVPSGDMEWHKARALWAALARAGHVRVNTDAALMAYVKRQTRREHWRFLNQAQVTAVIEALKKWCVRVHVPTDAPATAPEAAHHV